MRAPRLLSHPADLHCLVFHLVALLTYGVAFWLWLHPDAAGLTSVGGRVAFVLAAALMLGWISGIDVGVNFHNHTHRRIFRRAFLNRWFGRLWTFSGGWPAFFWQHAHVTVHHDHVLGHGDWTLPRRRADGSWESLFRYSVLHWPWRYAAHLAADFHGGRAGPQGGRRALRELGWFLLFWSVPFVIDPAMGLVLWAFPHWIANVLVMGPGMYAQHALCDEPSRRPMRHSNTFLSRFFNLTMFNIGYHTEHHEHPHVHWSELPGLHERMKDELIEHQSHVVPFGYYRGGQLLSALTGPRRSREKFAEQHPDYVRVPEKEPVAGGEP